MKNHFESLIPFTNEVINKRKLQTLMYLTFNRYGIVKSALIADQIKNLTFYYATKSGISLSVEDLRVPYKKRQLIGLTNNEVETAEQKYESGNITSVERFQKVIDIWNNASNFLKDDVITYFRESDPLNPLYIMAFSGARGNISQVRQLVGMRGLMADPQGQIIDLPIQSNFREGLKVTEYIISSYGARKGLVDTALRTADSGYLTRRLVDVAQDIIVREADCLTKENLTYQELIGPRLEKNASLKTRILGRLLAKPLISPQTNEILFPANTEICLEVFKTIEKFDIKTFAIRSPLTCDSLRSVCQSCYGWHLSYSKLVDLGEAVGIIAAQSIGEPGTQLTMRTFHTGGVFSGDLTRQLRTPFSGIITYDTEFQTTIVRTIHGEKGFLLRSELTIFIESLEGTKISLEIPQGNILLVNDGEKVYENQIIAEIKKDANLILEEDRKDILTDTSGETFFQNIDIQEQIEKGVINRISKNSGLVWVLYGDHYILPKTTKLEINCGNAFTTNEMIGQTQIINRYSGIAHFNESKPENIQIMHFSMVIKNASITSYANTKLLTILSPQKKRKT
jgi:DNA-directed RNA polymerase subunit beta'